MLKYSNSNFMHFYKIYNRNENKKVLLLTGFEPTRAQVEGRKYKTRKYDDEDAKVRDAKVRDAKVR